MTKEPPTTPGDASGTDRSRGATRHPAHARLSVWLDRGPRRRRWRARLDTHPALSRCYRSLVFLLGVGVVTGGAALYAFSTLLTLPLVWAALWIWSWEFRWARRMLHRFTLWARKTWRRVRRRPVTWSLLTLGGVAGGAATYWAALAFDVL